MSKKKKIIVLSCMIALLAVTAVFNFVLTKDSVSLDGDATTTASYFSQYKTDRTSTRNEQIVQLDEIISSSEDGSDVKTNALEMKLKLTEIMEHELRLENLLKAHGFENAVVTLSLTSDNVNVIVQDEELNQDEAISIYRIFAQELNSSPENIRIIPIY